MSSRRMLSTLHPPTSVSKALLWLKRPLAFRQRTSLLVTGIYRPTRNVGMNFINSTGAEKKIMEKYRHPEYFLIDNVPRRRVYNTVPIPTEYPNVSPWANIPDDCWDKLDAEGFTPVRRVFCGVMDAFPKYDLVTDEGIEAAIKDMTCRLSAVTNVSEVYVPSNPFTDDGALAPPHRCP